MDEKPNPFADRPHTFTRLDRLAGGQEVIVVTQAYGPGGESLMDPGEHRFSGERGVRLRVRQGELDEIVVLSPFYGDPSKVHEKNFEEGKACELLCPESGAPLDPIPGLKAPEGGAYYAVYLTPQLADGELVAVNNIWGNAHSHLMSEGELLAALADAES